MELPIHELCRLCGLKANPDLDIFDSDINEIIQEMFRIEVNILPIGLSELHSHTLQLIYYLFPLQLNDGKLWPRKACDVCFESISSLREMRENIKANQEFFGSLVTQIEDGELKIVENSQDSEEEPQDVEEEHDIEAGPSEIVEETEVLELEFDEEYETKTEILDQDYLDDDKPLASRRGRPRKGVASNKVFACTWCDDEFPDKLALKLHKKHHSFNCPVCQIPFKSQGALSLHSKVHGEDFPDCVGKRKATIVCEICGKVLATASTLAEHLKRHEDQQSEKCDICGKYYFNLKFHKSNTHSAKAKEVCSICGKEVSHLRRHMIRHQGTGKRFKCEFCEKRFHSTQDMRRHMNTHTGQRVKCLFCDHEATHMDNSRSHMKKKHPTEYQEMLDQNKLKRTHQTSRSKEGIILTSSAV